MAQRAIVFTAAAALVIGAAARGQAASAAAAAAACRWLEATIDPACWLRGTSGNTRGKRAVTAAIAAWALDVAGDDGRAMDPVLQQIVQGRSLEDAAFATWLLGAAAFPLAERTLCCGSAHRLLPEVAARLGALRNSERAWAHGSMEGTVPGYPSTLLAATNWAVAALGFAAAHGVDVPRDWIEDAITLLGEVQAPNGGLPYGGRPYRIGVEAGRTAGAVVALAAADRAATATFARAADYVFGNMELVPAGHASPAMHVWNGALAAFALGDAAWRRYEDRVLARVMAAQRADGSFDDVAGSDSPDTLALLGDELSGRAYVTALYASALLVPRSRLGAWLRSRVRFEAPAETPDPNGSAAALWRVRAAARALAADGRCAFVLDTDGAIAAHDLADGARRWREAVPAAIARDAVLQVQGEYLIAWSREAGTIAVFERTRRRWAWTAQLALAPFAAPSFGGDRLCAVAPDGAAVVLQLADGRERTRIALPGGLRQNAVLLANGSLLGAADARLVCFDVRGELAWRGRNRSEAASVAASWSQLVDGGEVFCGGSTDGVIVCRRTDDGSLVWTRALGGGITALAPCPAAGGRIAALVAGGVVSVLDARGKVAWSLDVSGGRQDPGGSPSRLAAGAERVWVHSTGRGRLAAFAWDGTAIGSWPVPAAAAWVVTGDRLVVADDDGVEAYAVR